MASSLQYSVDLQLPNLPLLSKAPPEVYNEFLLLYNALKLTAFNLDYLTGSVSRSSEEAKVLESDFTINPLANLNRTNFEFEVDAVRGNLMNINPATNKLRFAKDTTVARGFPPQFMAVESVAAGQVGEVIVQGVLTLPYTVTPNRRIGVNPAQDGELIVLAGAAFPFLIGSTLTNNSVLFIGGF